MYKILCWVGGVLLLITAIVLAVLLVETRASERRLEAEVRELRARARVVSPTEFPGATSVRAADTARTGSEAPDAVSAKREDGEQRRLRIQLSPEIQKIYFSQFQATSSLHYARLFRELRLDEARQRALEGLLSEKYWAVSDVTAAGLEKGMSMEDPVFAALKAEALKDVDGKIQGLLGADGFSRYNAYERAESYLSIIETFGGGAQLAGVAVSDQDTARLLDVLSTNAAAGREGTWIDAQVVGRSRADANWDAVNWEQALPQLRTVLSAEQLKVLNAARMRTLLERRAERQVSRKLGVGK